MFRVSAPMKTSQTSGIYSGLGYWVWGLGSVKPTPRRFKCRACYGFLLTMHGTEKGPTYQGLPVVENGKDDGMETGFIQE